MSVADTMVAVIEDDPGIRDLVTDLLRREGFEVLAYADAASFFRSAPVERLDCLILDVMLPGEDGLSICRTLRAARPRLPILMVSARGDDVDRIIGGVEAQARQRRETGGGVRLREPRDLRRLAHPHSAAERTLHEFGDAVQLRAAAGQHHLTRVRAGEAERLQTFAYFAGEVGQALGDNADQLGASNAVLLIRPARQRQDVFLSRPAHRHHLTVIGRGGDRRTRHAFQPLGLPAADAQAAG